MPLKLLAVSGLILAGLVVLPITDAKAQTTPADCDAYARDYANARVGSGDMVGDVVEGGMRGAVAGGQWRGPVGAKRGARVGGALGVMDNLGSLPGGWEALYDMAYQMCRNETSSANHQPSTLGNPSASSNCRSTATVQPVPPRPGGGISARSGCQ
jgi:hypothetical protein